MSSNAPVKKLQICSICHFGTRDRTAYLQHQKLHFNVIGKAKRPDSFMSATGLEIFVGDEEDGEGNGNGDGGGEGEQRIYSEKENYDLEDSAEDGAESMTYCVDLNTGLTCNP
jgi:hypothetical protein